MQWKGPDGMRPAERNVHPNENRIRRPGLILPGP